MICNSDYCIFSKMCGLLSLRILCCLDLVLYVLSVKSALLVFHFRFLLFRLRMLQFFKIKKITWAAWTTKSFGQERICIRLLRFWGMKRMKPKQRKLTSFFILASAAMAEAAETLAIRVPNGTHLNSPLCPNPQPLRPAKNHLSHTPRGPIKQASHN